jgi:hypothetical protein
MQLLQQRFDKLKQVIYLLQLAPTVLIHLTVTRQDMKRLQQFDGLASADLGFCHGG